MEEIDTADTVFKNVSNIIETSKFKFDYKFADESDLDLIIDFINKNYIDKDGDTTLIYSHDLINFFINGSIPILFYSKNNPTKPVAFIIGKYTEITSYNKKYGSIDGNFFCIIPQLRKMNLPTLLKAYLIRECLKKYNTDIQLAYFTTNKIINMHPICKKNYIHRCINYDELQKCGIVRNTKIGDMMYKKLYAKFIYPENLKEFKISQICEEKEFSQIAEKINTYQNQNFDIYENISENKIKNVMESNAFVKFIIYDKENNIQAFIAFFKLDILNKIYNKIVRTLYLHYYFVNGNIVDYLEYIAEYMKNNNICDMFLTFMFDEKVPDRYFLGSGTLYYNLLNIKPFNIKEHRLRLIVI
jgi:hypothetical protein